MKFAHISDLHLGKQLHGYSLIEDQAHMLGQVLELIDREKPDALLVAGDVYDRLVPSTAAMRLFDDFLHELSQRSLESFIIAGNHDSPERLAYGYRIFDRSGIHIITEYTGKLSRFRLVDEHGELELSLLPFVRPVQLRKLFPERELASYTEAMDAALCELHCEAESEPQLRRVLVTHQFVTGAERSESEEIFVGGSDNVSAAVFDDFDYVALGHLHRPQNIGSLRYCGSPLAYSFSEAGQAKSLTIAELGPKGQLALRTLPLAPLHKLTRLRGDMETLLRLEFLEGTTLADDLVQITLTDEQEIPDAVAKLRQLYKNLLRLEYDNSRTRRQESITAPRTYSLKTPAQLFSEFYQLQNNAELTREQSEYVSGIIDELWRE